MKWSLCSQKQAIFTFINELCYCLRDWLNKLHLKYVFQIMLISLIHLQHEPHLPTYAALCSAFKGDLFSLHHNKLAGSGLGSASWTRTFWRELWKLVCTSALWNVGEPLYFLNHSQLVRSTSRPEFSEIKFILGSPCCWNLFLCDAEPWNKLIDDRHVV